jgi:hypothetical protein
MPPLRENGWVRGRCVLFAQKTNLEVKKRELREKSHPEGADSVVTSGSWADDKKGTATEPWPSGCENNSIAFSLCWAFFRFTYWKNKAASIKVILCEVMCSLVPPACSYHFGTGLLDELSERTVSGRDERARIIINTSLFAVGTLLLRVFTSWFQVYYSNSIPAGGLRTALRDVLFHRVQHLQSPLKDKLTPGSCSGMIVDIVNGAVDIYSDFLIFPVSDYCYFFLEKVPARP